VSTRGLTAIAHIAHLEEREARIGLGVALAKEADCRERVPAPTPALVMGEGSGAALHREMLLSALSESHRRDALGHVEDAVEQVDRARTAWAAAASADKALERLLERRLREARSARARKEQRALDESGIVQWGRARDDD